jgi:mono/diheme cytochrome c family protein
MQFMLSPLNAAETIKKEEATFRDIQAYILSLRPPKYPFAIDQGLATKGEQVFSQTCARCHGHGCQVIAAGQRPLGSACTARSYRTRA